MLSDATEGICTALVGWHIESGHHRDVRLDGLGMALAVQPENMAKGNWRVAAYVDDRATAGQRKLSRRSSEARRAAIRPHWRRTPGELCGLAVVPLTFGTDGRKSGSGSATWEGRRRSHRGSGGVSPTIQNHLLAIAPGFPWSSAVPPRLGSTSTGYASTLTGKSALLSPFRYSG
jgi:hypothetical protein